MTIQLQASIITTKAQADTAIPTDSSKLQDFANCISTGNEKISKKIGDFEKIYNRAMQPLGWDDSCLDKPDVSPLTVDRENAVTIMPSLTKHLASLENYCRAASIPFEFGATLVNSEDMGPSKYHSNGSVIIMNIPDYLSPQLHELASQVPHVEYVRSLDLKSTAGLMMWCVGDASGGYHKFAIDDRIIRHMVDVESRDEKQPLWNTRIIFCCGDKVSFSQNWFSFPELFGTYGIPPLTNCRKEVNSDAVLSDTIEKTAATGSAMPWMHATWKNEFGHFLTQLLCIIKPEVENPCT